MRGDPCLTIEAGELTELRVAHAVMESEQAACETALSSCGSKITGLMIETGTREQACIEELARIKSVELTITAPGGTP